MQHAHNNEKFSKAYVAKLNRRTDLPFYLARVKVKVVGPLEKFTDDDLKILGINPLPEDR